MRTSALLIKEINTHLIRRTCVRLSILILVGCLFFLEQYSYGLYFSNEIVIDDTSSLPQEPDIDIQRSVNSKSDNIAYVVWSDNTSGNGDIYFRRSLDNGSLFANIINIAKNNGSSISPQIATAGNGNNVYVVWSDNTTGNGDIYFRRSLDSGDNFDRRKFVSKNNGSSTSPQIATAGNGNNNVYVVWSDNTTGNGDIYFRRSLDNGSSFETSKNLSNNPGNSSDPHIFVDQKNVYIVWTDETTGNGDIYMKTSSIFEANANNFSRTKNLSRNNGSSTSPQIATAGNGNNVYVVWSDNTTGNGDIYFRRSLDSGDNFDRRKFVSKNNGSSISPQIATAGNGNNNVYVVWSDNTTGNGDIYFRRSLDNGDNFEGRDRLDGNLTRSFNPHIETSGDANIYIVWHGVGPNIRTEVFFRASGDGGLSFDKPVLLTKDSLRSGDTNLVSSQNGLYMVWVEEDSSPTEDGKVNLKRISEDFFDRKQAMP